LFLAFARRRQAYGLTEHSCITLSHCAPDHARGNSKKGSVGFILPNLEVKFIDPETGKSLPQNQRGELCVRSQCVTIGKKHRRFSISPILCQRGA
jgi:4-coumarate--CoA ligase